MQRIDYVQGDEWEGVYIDGTLEFEGHDVRGALIELLGQQLGLRRHTANEDWLCDEGNLPNDFSQVKLEQVNA